MACHDNGKTNNNIIVIDVHVIVLVMKPKPNVMYYLLYYSQSILYTLGC